MFTDKQKNVIGFDGKRLVVGFQRERYVSDASIDSSLTLNVDSFTGQ